MSESAEFQEEEGKISLIKFIEAGRYYLPIDLTYITGEIETTFFEIEMATMRDSYNLECKVLDYWGNKSGSDEFEYLG